MYLPAEPREIKDFGSLAASGEGTETGHIDSILVSAIQIIAVLSANKRKQVNAVGVKNLSSSYIHGWHTRVVFVW